MKRIVLVFVFALITYSSSSRAFAQAQRWTEQKANSWYEQQPWLVGSNYIPADAINELEMWQEQTFDLPQIEKELGWAEGLGMHEDHACLLARSAMAAGVGGFQKEDRHLFDHRRKAPHPASLCSV